MRKECVREIHFHIYRSSNNDSLNPNWNHERSECVDKIIQAFMATTVDIFLTLFTDIEFSFKWKVFGKWKLIEYWSHSDRIIWILRIYLLSNMPVSCQCIYIYEYVQVSDQLDILHQWISLKYIIGIRIDASLNI